MFDILFQNLTADKAVLIGAFLAGLLMPAWNILSRIIKNVKNKRAKKIAAHFRHMNEVDVLIHEILTQLRLLLKCNRVSVSQFHNGEQYFSGSSIQKASITHESVSPGITAVAGVRNSVPVSMIPCFIYLMHKDEFCTVDVGTLSEEFIKQSFMNAGTNAVIIVPLRQGPHRIIGSLEAHWANHDAVISNEQYEEGTVLVKRIENLLTQQYFDLKGDLD